MTRTPLVLALLAISLVPVSIPAAEEARPVISALPDVPAAIHSAIHSRDFEEAARLIDARLTGEKIENADYLLYLKGRVQTAAGKLDEASATFGSLEKRFPKSRWISRSRFGRADVLVRQRNYRAAGLIYQAEAQRLLSTDRRNELAGIYLEFADRYFEGDKDDPSEKGKPNYTQALTYYQESLKLTPGVATQRRVELRIAHSQRELGKLAEAISTYQSFLKRYAGEKTAAIDRAPAAMIVQATYQLGSAQLAAGQRENARRTWQDFLASEVGQTDGGELLAEAAYRLAHTYRVPTPGSIADLELGVAAHESFLKTYPKSELAPQASLEIAQSYAHHGRHEQAVSRLQTLLKDVNPEAKQIPLARNLLGRVLASQKKFEEAIAVWREFLARHPSDPNWSNVQLVVINTEYTMAEVQRAEKNYDAARNLWVTFLNKYPLDSRAPQILFLFGHMKFSEGLAQWQKELEAARADGAVLTKPIPPKPRTGKLFEEAISDWQQLVRKYPNSQQASQAAFSIGSTRENQLGQLDLALEAYKKVRGTYEAQAKQRIDNLTARQLQVVTERKFHTDEKPRIRITTRNIEKLSVRMYRIDMVDYFRKMHLATGVESLDIALIDPDKTWEHEVAGFEEYLSLSNEVEIPVEGPGVTAVTVSGNELEATTMVVVSDLDLIVKSSRN